MSQNARDTVASPVCADVRADLSLLLDGELPSERAANARHHLATCPGCRLELGAWRDVRARLGALLPRPGVDPVPVPGGLAELQRGVLAAVRKDVEVGAAVEPVSAAEDLGPALAVRPGRIRWGAIAAMLLFATGIALGRYGSGAGDEALRGGSSIGTPGVFARGPGVAPPSAHSAVWSGHAAARGRTEPVSFDLPSHERRRLQLLLDLAETDKSFHVTRTAELLGD
jgi:hypothetical protein